ncbi:MULTISPECIES: hypothetical protein [unclassified Streptosporangium]|uniref:hypothetical protein n=1 Tax=unclassified Streptosporangium TaxID=2632669 RepID=UPI002E2B89AB|nr:MULTISPECIES: hypothetical protein [unclassified Streptosporangium]
MNQKSPDEKPSRPETEADKEAARYWRARTRLVYLRGAVLVLWVVFSPGDVPPVDPFM